MTILSPDDLTREKCDVMGILLSHPWVTRPAMLELLFSKTLYPPDRPLLLLSLLFPLPIIYILWSFYIMITNTLISFTLHIYFFFIVIFYTVIYTTLHYITLHHTTLQHTTKHNTTKHNKTHQTKKKKKKTKKTKKKK